MSGAQSHADFIVDLTKESNEDDNGDLEILDEDEVAKKRMKFSFQDVASKAECSNLGDEDIVIVGADASKVALRDLPHERQHCKVYDMNPQDSKSNVHYCPLCFCYVCDVEASNCKMWGTGTTGNCHCNARKSNKWDALRRERQLAKTKQASVHSSGLPDIDTNPRPNVQKKLPFAKHPLNPHPLNSHPLNPSSRHASSSASLAGSASLLGANKKTHAAEREKSVSSEKSREGARVWPKELEPLPDPALDHKAMEVGRFSFPVKAVGGKTLSEVKVQLSRTGFYIKRTYNPLNNPELYGRALCLNNLFDLTRPSGFSGGYYEGMPKVLELRVQPDQDAEAEEVLDEMRVRRMKVIDSTGHHKPIIMGIKVHKKANVEACLQMLGKAFQPSISFDNEQLLCMLPHHYPARICPFDEVLDELQHWSYMEGAAIPVVYRVARLTPCKPTCDTDVSCLPTQSTTEVRAQAAAVDTEGNGANKLKKPQSHVVMVRLFVNKKRERQPAHRHLRASSYYSLYDADNDIALHTYDDDDDDDDDVHGIVYGTVFDNAYDDDEGEEDEDNLCYVYHDINRTQSIMSLKSKRSKYREEQYWVEDSGKIALSISLEHTQSGEKSFKAISDSLRTALQPLLRSEASTGAEEGGPSTCNGAASATPLSGSLRSEARAAADAATCSRQAPALASSEGAPQTTSGPFFKLFKDLITHDLTRGIPWSRNGQNLVMATCSDNWKCYTISACWDEREGKCPYDLASLQAPELHTSASKEAVAETIKLIEKERKQQEEKKRLNWFPYEVVAELKSEMLRPYPEQTPKMTEFTASIAVTVDIESTPGDSTDVEGIAKFVVYTWREGALQPGTRSLFQPWDEWGAAVDQRVLSDYGRNGSSGFPLKKTMSVIFKDVPEAMKMQEVLRVITRDASTHSLNLHSINGLLRYLESGERPAAPQPVGLSVSLRNYQLQSVKFMLDAEARPGGFRSLFWAKKVVGSKCYWYSEMFGRMSLEVPTQASGGFLAEEMGLGKTVEVLALILSAPPPLSLVSGIPHMMEPSRLTSRATLVVCAVSLVGQWVVEAKSKSAGSLKILQYHGSSRERDPRKIASDYDLVVTTYQTLGSDYHRDSKVDDFAPLGKIYWYRIVFDEGHMVKSGSAQQSKACVALRADRRWCCTGTPIGTSIEDLLGQFAVIHLSPMSTKLYFDSRIKIAFGAGSNRHRAYGISETGPAALLYTLKECMIRHTKQQVLGGEQVLQLPPKTEEDLPVSLTTTEKALYLRVHSEVQLKWMAFRAAGAATVTRYQLTIMSLLGPLRRIASGGALRPRDLTVPSLDPSHMMSTGSGAGGGQGAVAAIVNALEPNSNLVSPEAECSICLDTMEHPVATPCNHWFCRECIIGWLDSKTNCALCRAPLTGATLRAGVMPGQRVTADSRVGVDGEEGAAAAAAAAVEEEEGPAEMCESKLRALLVELRKMRAADASAKALVFSQYNTTLEWLKTRLTDEGFGFRTINGSMPMKQRTKAIEAFQNDPPTTVFLLSMRSGAVGINLTAASHVFIMEPCLNPALEEQAIGRSWRMGQQRTVVVKRFFTKGSVEEAIMKVVKARRDAGAKVAEAAAANGADEATALAAAQAYLVEQQERGYVRREGLQRAVAAAIAGSIRSDKQALRMSEMEELFAPPKFDVTETIAAETAVAGTSGVGASDGLGTRGPMSAEPSQGAITSAALGDRGRDIVLPAGGSVGPSSKVRGTSELAGNAAGRRLSGRKRKAVNYAQIMQAEGLESSPDAVGGKIPKESRDEEDKGNEEGEWEDSEEGNA
ncbi:hypothetical protein CEUSTIGMA_g161.t1 [Chlamydomonas eustigma]|uniref:RING-type domain-containing protein n=1 Tax=Chlamydomonas eustigma TaxID=1157962 RepID=A0A250WPE0_9CHLO|nr:hypothetical protein CEUSTIGMA_g161.t1 [Chlamydomonas eustigma]|eukprot:GAX72705.1 hypothetical protein CEUSTIGMA_g161.t1 [Chlamydomonas eustigma]